MPEFRYKAKSFDGKIITASMQADSEESFRKLLKEQNLFLIQMEASESKSEKKELSIKKMTNKELTVFCRQLSAMLGAGVTVIHALDILYQQTDKKNVKQIIRKLYEDVQKGDMFSEALKKQQRKFPEIMVSMIESGEASGTIDQVISKLATQFEKDGKLRNKIIASMIYPAVLSVLAVGAVILMVTAVLPVFAEIFKSSGVALPGPTQMLLGLSYILTNFWYLVLGGIALLVFGVTTYIKTPAGRLKWDGLKLKIPVVKSTVIKVAAARFCRTLSTLVSSGISLIQCLEITARVIGNKVITNALIDAKEDVRKGMPLSMSIKKMGMFPPVVHSMFSIGEESGTLDDVLQKVSDYIDDEVETSIQRLVSLLEPAVMIFMAVIIGFIVISIVMPMFDMYSLVGK